MAWLSASFPNYELNEGTMTVYWDMLNDLDDDALKVGMKKCVAEGKWFPTIAELRQATASFLPAIVAMPDKYTAWMNVTSTLSTEMGYKARTILHHVTEHAVKAIGGWHYLSLSENMVSDRARFLEAYDVFSSQYREAKSELPAIAEYKHKLLTKPEED